MTLSHRHERKGSRRILVIHPEQGLADRVRRAYRGEVSTVGSADIGLFKLREAARQGAPFKCVVVDLGARAIQENVALIRSVLSVDSGLRVVALGGQPIDLGVSDEGRFTRCTSNLAAVLRQPSLRGECLPEGQGQLRQGEAPGQSIADALTTLAAQVEAAAAGAPLSLPLLARQLGTLAARAARSPVAGRRQETAAADKSPTFTETPYFEAPKMARGAESTAPRGQHLPVLVVEDDPVNRLVALKILERSGCEVQSATCGRAAIEAVMSRRYALVLMDVGLPDMSGLEATRQIRSLEREQGRWRTEIIALTAYSAEGHVARCLEAGMDGYEEKPMRRDALSALVQAARGRATSRLRVVAPTR